MKKKKRTPILIYYIIALVVIILINAVLIPKLREPEIVKIEYNEFIEMIEEGKISKVEIDERKIRIEPKEQKGVRKLYYETGSPNIYHNALTDLLLEADIDFKFPIQEETSMLMYLFINFLPILVLIGASYFIFRSASKRMGGGVMNFGKSTGKIYAERETGKTFDDVAGQDEAKRSLVEIIDFLNNPEKYSKIGAKLPKGALLVGPPGTGKTLLAKAVAGEAKVPFFSLSGSEFVEMFVGVGAARVRDLFKQAVANAPCIIFIDEIDAIGKSRDNAIGSNDEREQTLNQLLSEMDGFDSSKGVVILAATNRPEVLDKALLRPGRFDRRITVDLPDMEGRKAILKVHARGVKMDENVDFDVVARSTPGASGADLENIINEAALRAVRANKNIVTQKELEEAAEVILAGEEKKSTVLSEKEKWIVSYHEIGHALVSALLKNTAPVHKITIIPRTSGALGYTMQIEEQEKYLITKEEILDRITVLAGGRASELVQFGTATTGAANDIERATHIARAMVTMYGMSDEFGFVKLEKKTNPFLSDDVAGSYSEETAAKVDEETRSIVNSCLNKAIDLLKDKKEVLDKLSKILFEKETITGTEFIELLKQENIHVTPEDVKENK
ncbi:MAG TPA: ATP-dependent zinc metalloprotease FtsH [Clostridiaceae bacterium]|jgi:cell division protease FtsH|nr:ATP-dependent zinc metalloprotease FtsH [Clostridiaceae bacterium]